MVVDGSLEQTGKKSALYERFRTSNMFVKTTEPYIPRLNRDEGWIGRLKKKWRNRMRQNGVPKRLWDYAFMCLRDPAILHGHHHKGRVRFDIL